MKPYISFTLLLLLSCGIQVATAQSLQRRGSLGVRMDLITDSLVDAQGLSPRRGVLIVGVQPGGTAHQIAIEPGDILLDLNGEAADHPACVVALASDFWEGDPIQVTLWRDGVTRVREGHVAGQPREASDMAEVLYEAVAFQDGHLRIILYRPTRGTAPYPVVFFLQGFGCGSIDYGSAPDHPVRRIADGLAQAGIAMFRVEKPGVGDSQGTAACAEIGYDEELAAFEAGYAALLQQSFVDPQNVFLFGHSLGGTTAPLLARYHQPKGIITYGAVAKSWFEYLIDYHRKQLEIRGFDYRYIETATREHIPLLYEYLILKKTPDELAQDPALEVLLDQRALGFDGNDQFFGRHYTFLQQIQDKNLTEAWIAADVHTLALHGEYDLQAISSDAAQTIANIVNAYHDGKGTYRLVPGTEHGFTRVPSMQAYLDMRSSGVFTARYASEHFNASIIDVVVAWITDKVQGS